ncbi:aldo/keto reductase [Dactylosporangium matsuzakiense]|uniref:Oxidoreductase n=1 Tax=Dactylosporangium matsuzakiense TaxID=53360 RepID=A0A9W6KRH7_9ACTN|nr:aldo/keto reductase [Dactylosporangium matsuzakiense]UWZ43693.1 aldo/keto reductase [Dactylosporangium matsuzakiense]GLL05820.1 oxidoreductase [Dactylosporangium matsuzakiense]
MRYRTFGRTGLRVSELVLGAMTFGEQGGVGAPIDDCRKILDRYTEAGGNMIDTAINYRGGASEEIVGELLQDRRSEFVVSTKYTVTRNADDPNGGGNHRRNLRLSLETSLRRLRTDWIDVYWVHIWDRHTPIEETMRALDDAITKGQILYCGISDTPAWLVSRANTLAEWRGWTQFAGLQVPYSLVNRDAERELLPMAADYGMAVTAWSPLGGGILTGKYELSEQGRLNAADISPDDRAVAQAVAAAAGELGVTPAQVALAWARQKGVLPMLGARTEAQIRDNLGSLDVTLPPEMSQQLEQATNFKVGFPTDFIDQTSRWVLGKAAL